MRVSDLMVSSDNADKTSPADPIAEKIDAIAMLHARAESMVERYQHNVEAVTEWIGRPRTLFAVVFVVALWIVSNSLGLRFGASVADPPPFYWLQGAIGLSALLLTIVVLITQNRMGKLAVQREQLDLQISLMVGFPILAITLCMLLDRSVSSYVVWGAICAAIGFFLPRYALWKKTLSRQQRIRWALADALDLMVIAVEAGLGLNAALNRVGDELKTTHPDLHNELELVNLEIRVGRGRDEALRNLAERTGVDDVRSFVALLIQADRYGSSIAKAVRVFADSLRTQRRQRAEQASQKAALKLLFPLTAFLFPVIVMIILAPAVLNLVDLFGGL